MKDALIKFNGRYTIESPKGGHRTFQIKTYRHGPKAGARVVSLLTGPDNTSSYTKFGYVNDDGIYVWENRRGGDFEVYAKMLESFARYGDESFFAKRGYKLLVEKRCRRCNRVLTHPESVKSGLGPECANRV